MSVRSLLLAILAGFLLPLGSIQLALSPWVPVGRGIEYHEYVLSGPNRVYVARMDRHNPTITIEAGLAGGALSQPLETVPDIITRYNQTLNHWRDLDDPNALGSWGKTSNVVVAINGSYPEESDHSLPQNGLVQSGWYAKRFTDFFGWSGFAWKLNGETFIGDCVFHDSGAQNILLPDGSTITIDSINSPAADQTAVIYTPLFGGRTPGADGIVEVVVELTEPLGITNPGQPVEGRVLRIHTSSGGTPILFDQVVIALRGSSAERALAVINPESRLQFTQVLNHSPECKPESGLLASWDGVYASIGGGHTFLRNGEVFLHNEDPNRHPRTAVAYNDNHIFFIVVDGRDPQRSIGMTIEELGNFARDQLGATWAIAQDGGGSSTMVVNGVVVNNPSDVCQGEQVYLPAVNQNFDPAVSEPPTIKPAYVSGIQSGHCLRPVINGLMMVEVQPFTQSFDFSAGETVLATEEVNLRSGPGTNYAVLGRFQPGTQMSISDHANRLNGVLATGYSWWLVDIGGLKGWIAGEFLALP